MKEHQSGHAFGHPGLSPTWQTARKIGLGTAYSPRSRVWLTLARGIVTEVYYPRVDTANTRDLQFLASDGRTFVHEEQRDLRHEVACTSATLSTSLDDGVPAYQVVSTDPEGRYRLTKGIVTDPEADALMMQVAFEALRGRAEDYALYLLLNPQVKNQGWRNFLPVHRETPASSSHPDCCHLPLPACISLPALRPLRYPLQRAGYHLATGRRFRPEL